MRLEEIGFYTLSDRRASTANEFSELARCEIVLTDRCNFSCPYCRGLREDIRGDMPFEFASYILNGWCAHGLKNVRFSGGEPMLYKQLPKLVELCAKRGVERIAVSTNGSLPPSLYSRLIDAGVSDFSVSFDACCSSTGATMSGRDEETWYRVVDCIEYLASQVYTTVGVVLTKENLPELDTIVQLADTLGVADIRIIPAAQYSRELRKVRLDNALLEKYPILDYRIKNVLAGKPVRGLSKEDNKKCPLVLDDMAVAGHYHFPCIIYMREQGNPIGQAGVDMGAVRESRARWYQTHDCYADPICSKNCLDVCVDYNNRWASYGDETQHEENLLNQLGISIEGINKCVN
jgi:pyruvate-formate lyase-activating enzyme